MKTFSSIFLAILILISTAGCSQNSKSPVETNKPVISSQSPEALQTDNLDTDSDTFIFTDSLGREVELPKDIQRIAPSGPLAQVVLLTLCPDKLVGLGTEVSENQFEYIDKKYQSLPVFGNFYGETLNLETVLSAGTQVVMDIGEAKPTAYEDMEGIQKKTGIPSIFIQMDLTTIVNAYKTLGDLVDEQQQAEKLADYIEKTLTETDEKSKTIPESDRLKVYYSRDEGLTPFVKGTVHSDVIDIAAGINVADVQESARGGVAEISLEQLMLWDPDVILFSPVGIYDKVGTLSEWSEISAIKNGAFYEIPEGPYNWMGGPPSVNRILGIKWLSNLLYPEIFEYDMVKEAQDFYQLFYHCEITEDQARELLANSTFKQ